MAISFSAANHDGVALAERQQIDFAILFGYRAIDVHKAFLAAGKLYSKKTFGAKFKTLNGITLLSHLAICAIGCENALYELLPAHILQHQGTTLVERRDLIGIDRNHFGAVGINDTCLSIFRHLVNVIANLLHAAIGRTYCPLHILRTHNRLHRGKHNYYKKYCSSHL